MCVKCVVDPQLDRGRLCSDSGALQSNLKFCHGCQDKSRNMKVDKTGGDKNEEEEDVDNDVEVVEYKHLCSSCGHEIASHRHEFWVEDGYQEYRMDCLLCGIGEDSISVLPRDPRKASAFSEL